MRPSELQLFEQIAPGKRVRLVSAGGAETELPFQAPIPQSEAPREEIVELRAAVVSLSELIEQTSRQHAGAVLALAEELRAAGERAAQAQAQLVVALNRISIQLAAPVKPVYDKAGKLIGARRDPTEGGA